MELCITRPKRASAFPLSNSKLPFNDSNNEVRVALFKRRRTLQRRDIAFLGCRMELRKLFRRERAVSEKGSNVYK